MTTIWFYNNFYKIQIEYYIVLMYYIFISYYNIIFRYHNINYILNINVYTKFFFIKFRDNICVYNYIKIYYYDMYAIYRRNRRTNEIKFDALMIIIAIFRIIELFYFFKSFLVYI